jgi:transcription antitermination factor NusG
MIVPRSPSPVPLDDRDIDSLSPDDMRELIRRQRERDAAARVVKREHGIKREHSRERSGTSGTFDVNEGNVSVVSAKRRRLPVTIDEDGTETIDLT